MITDGFVGGGAEGKIFGCVLDYVSFTFPFHFEEERCRERSLWVWMVFCCLDFFFTSGVWGG